MSADFGRRKLKPIFSFPKRGRNLTFFKLEDSNKTPYRLRRLMKFDIRCIVPSSKTSGKLAVFKEKTPPQFGPPLHTHVSQYEIFHVISGKYLFQCDGEQSTLETGDSIVIPPKAVHSFKNIGAETGTLHFELLEAGKSEAFFEKIVSDFPDIEDMPAFFAAHGLELVGPPL